MTNPAFVTSGAAALTPGLAHLAQTPLTQSSPSVYYTPPSTRCVTMSASRKFLVGGNWKCNLNKASIAALCAAFNEGPPLDDQVDVVVAPPSLYVESVRSQLRADFSVSAQNTWLSAGGAFTGELDATMVKDVGGDWAILGHSERRHTDILKESDETIAQKSAYALTEAGLKVIFCVGEKLEEREAGNTLAVCERQLAALAAAISDWTDVVIAYEPVWAIGTGKVATPEQAEEVHVGLRSWLQANVSKQVADSTRILYGGSVSPKNCKDLAVKPNIDGFLVGGASLKPNFLEIVDSYKTALASV